MLDLGDDSCVETYSGYLKSRSLTKIKGGENMGKENTPEVGIIRLCGTQGCCPTVDFTSPRMVVLKDDFGGEVKLTSEQWRDMMSRFA